MEPKDLILLMLIPILLISIVVYTDRTPAITAAVTAQQKQSDVIGTYSIMPSFRAKINYDLNDYTIIKKSLDFISKCSESGGEIESCVKQAESVDGRFEWALGCDKGAEKVLYDFAEFYQDCFDSDDSNCLCRKNFDIPKEEIEKYRLYTSGKKVASYYLELNQDIPSQKIEIKLTDPAKLAYSIKLNGRSVWYPKNYVVAYTKDRLYGLNTLFIDELSGTPFGFGPVKDIIIYKHEINGINAADFIKEVNSQFFYPNDVKIESDNLHDCELNPKNTAKFCVTKKGSKVMAYDKSDEQIKERDVTIKFASYVPNPPPPPLKNAEVYDKPKAEKSVLIKFGKSIDKDIAKYRVYYTEKQDAIGKTSTKDLRKNGVNAIELNPKISDAIDFDNAAECEFDYGNKKCYFSTIGGGKAPVENSKLYYSIAEGGTYIYGLNIEDGKEYDFAVSAVDKSNNEIGNIGIKQKLPIIKSAKSVDDLAPDSGGIDASPNYDASSKEFTFNIRKYPAKNIDGSELKDFKNFKVYYKKYQDMNEYNAGKSRINSLLLKDLKTANILGQTDSYIKASLAEDAQAGNIFHFVAIAVDKSENPLNSEYKVMETGAKPFGMEMQENGAALLP